MSQDAIAAVGRANSDPSERYRVQVEPIDMRALDATQSTPAVSNGGANIATPSARIEPEAPAAMNLQSLAGQFSDGLQHGFYAGDIDRLMHKLVQAREPNSGVSFGDVTVELLNVQAKVGIADAFSKVSSKLADGLQTMVVKQG